MSCLTLYVGKLNTDLKKLNLLIVVLGKLFLIKFLFQQIILEQQVWANEYFSFFPSTLRYKPIRRRVIWLIGQWISVKFKSDLRPMLYEAIRNLLQDQDLVVSVNKCCFLLQLLPKHWWYINSVVFVKGVENCITLPFRVYCVL